AAKLAVHANRIFIGPRRARAGINLQIVGTDHRDLARVATGRRVERVGRDRGRTGVNRADLCRQYALVEPPVTCSQYRSGIVAELGGDAQAWRHQVPRVQRAKATDDASCFTPIQVDRVKVLTDGAVVVE